MSDINDFISGQIPLWVSGRTVVQWRYVISPLDGEVYQRTAATGSGATDPANDITNYAAASYTRTTALSVKGPVDNRTSVPANFANGALKTSIAGIVAGTRTQILSLSGRGVITFLAVIKNATNNGTVEVISDGITILNTATVNATATTAHVLIGSPGSGDFSGAGNFAGCYTAILDASGVNFRRTFAVWYTPTTSDTGANATLAYDLKSTR